MIIELHLNGEFFRAWVREDIREDWSEQGGIKWQKQIDREINFLKRDNYYMLEYNEYQFFVVYESWQHMISISQEEMIAFENQLKIRDRKVYTKL